MGLNGAELFLIIGIIVLVVAVGRLPNIGEAIGKMKHGFKKGLEGERPGDDAKPLAASAAASTPVNRAPTAEEIVGPEEDAQLVEHDET